ncbi:MAG: hypothetical protein LBQ27_00465 [Clostridiales bacterium]|jgi:hypothetical protein|nr:hypothetical protein [Clostridiales bacterium]
MDLDKEIMSVLKKYYGAGKVSCENDENWKITHSLCRYGYLIACDKTAEIGYKTIYHSVEITPKGKKAVEDYDKIEKELDLLISADEIAKKSNDIAVDANNLSKKANKRSFWSNILSLIAVIVSIVAILITICQSQ